MSVIDGRIAPRRGPLSVPYWEGCMAGELRLQHCQDCDRYQYYPRILCSHCGGRHLEWRRVSGRGRVASYTVIHRAVSAAYPTPSTVLLVDLDEGPRMMSSLVEDDSGTVQVGDAVSVEFQPWTEGVALPVFRRIVEENT